MTYTPEVFEASYHAIAKRLNLDPQGYGETESKVIESLVEILEIANPKDK